ncbi:putative bifunctional diguanylate cyclase/phosphodiesterase [Gynuella sunshinyii]|uniref:Putative signal transduction protein containing a membrane domain, an EAL and a GGDEF domain n=1 Tax=Gynuella sunshinyii YC6258 TaxID=1445510 RepID=A0A0C5UY50_9GAMM|nr:EAL domain-containing protein [Gynuella sunshinyii]AJQ92210.1 putative signal transduction protein containing a membrane domain, an EAL and a GGDEF domain [Gynuella sunshinyii YC6258]
MAEHSSSDNWNLRTGLFFIFLSAVLLMVMIYLENTLRQTYLQNLQLDTTRELDAVASRLGATITENISWVNGLAAHISINPEISQSEFRRYVQAVLFQKPLLINMAAAPDLVVTMVHPVQQNQQVIGFDYRTSVDQWPAVARAIETGRLIVAGPIALVQGGRGLVARKAIHDPDGELWGVVAAAIDADALFQKVGLPGNQLGIDLAIRGKDGLGFEGEMIWGNPELFADARSQLTTIPVGDGTWLFAAQPKSGWDGAVPVLGIFRTGFLVTFILFCGFFYSRYQKHTQDLRYQRILEKQATYDQLTGLPNRILFEDTLAKAISLASRDHYKLALLFIDLDRFKPVNDNLGHKAGDLLLQQVTERINRHIRDSDTLARYSGDEFIVILNHIHDDYKPDTVAENILATISEPFVLTNNQVFCSASIGISVFPDDGKTNEELVSKADQAMYEVKNSGRNGWHYFTRSMQTESENRHILYTRLVQAIAERSLEVYYQPIVQLNDRFVSKCEALVRWFSDGQQIPNYQFIELAEETGMINEIDHFVLETAAAYLKQQSQELNVRLGLSVNLSPRLFLNKDQALLKWLNLILGAADSIDLTVEITERLLMAESDQVNTILHQLRDRGITIAIDDFGTGYSSLSYILKFPIDIIKIDRSFINKIGLDDKSEALTDTIINMAHRMGCLAVAEGIETEAQYTYLKRLGCDFGQGYYFDKPMDQADFSRRLKQQHKS